MKPSLYSHRPRDEDKLNQTPSWFDAKKPSLHSVIAGNKNTARKTQEEAGSNPTNPTDRKRRTASGATKSLEEIVRFLPVGFRALEPFVEISQSPLLSVRRSSVSVAAGKESLEITSSKERWTALQRLERLWGVFTYRCTMYSFLALLSLNTSSAGHKVGLPRWLSFEFLLPGVVFIAISCGR